MSEKFKDIRDMISADGAAAEAELEKDGATAALVEKPKMDKAPQMEAKKDGAPQTEPKKDEAPTAPVERSEMEMKPTGESPFGVRTPPRQNRKRPLSDVEDNDDEFGELDDTTTMQTCGRISTCGRSSVGQSPYNKRKPGAPRPVPRSWVVPQQQVTILTATSSKGMGKAKAKAVSGSAGSGGGGA